MKPVLKKVGSSSSLLSVSSIGSNGSKVSLASNLSNASLSSLSPKPRWNAPKVPSNDYLNRAMAVAFLKFVLDLLLNLRSVDCDVQIMELKESLDLVGYNMYEYKQQLEQENALKELEDSMKKKLAMSSPKRRQSILLATNAVTSSNLSTSGASFLSDISTALFSKPKKAAVDSTNESSQHFPMFWREIPHHQDKHLRTIMYEIALKTSPNCMNMLLVEQKRDRLIDAYVKLFTRSARAIINTQVEDNETPDLTRYQHLCELFEINYFHSETFEEYHKKAAQLKDQHKFRVLSHSYSDSELSVLPKRIRSQDSFCSSIFNAYSPPPVNKSVKKYDEFSIGISKKFSRSNARTPKAHGIPLSMPSGDASLSPESSTSSTYDSTPSLFSPTMAMIRAGEQLVSGANQSPDARNKYNNSNNNNSNNNRNSNNMINSSSRSGKYPPPMNSHSREMVTPKHSNTRLNSHSHSNSNISYNPNISPTNPNHNHNTERNAALFLSSPTTTTSSPDQSAQSHQVQLDASPTVSDRRPTMDKRRMYYLSHYRESQTPEHDTVYEDDNEND